MSLAWRILQDAIENGHVMIDTQGADKEAVCNIQQFFSKPLISDDDVAKKSSFDLNTYKNQEESTALDNDQTSFAQDSVKDLDSALDPIAIEKKKVPLHEERIQEYLDDAARKLAAAKAYRRRLLSGKTRNTDPVKKPKRQCRIYRDIVLEKLSPKFAIPRADFKELVDEVMEEEFPGFDVDNEALVALQRESEMMATKMMCLAGHLANHASRETVRVKDFEFLKFLFYKNREGCYYDSGC